VSLYLNGGLHLHGNKVYGFDDMMLCAACFPAFPSAQPIGSFGWQNVISCIYCILCTVGLHISYSFLDG
jgi:hypothetical protein